MCPRSAKKALDSTASIATLLCITIAVSLATLAWTNGLPTSNIYTEDLQPTNHEWGPNCAYIDVTLNNNGTKSVILNSVSVNSQPTTVVFIAGSSLIRKGENAILRIANTFTPGATCQLAFQTSKGNRFSYKVTSERVSSISKIE
jgi:hypothetical protein